MRECIKPVSVLPPQATQIAALLLVGTCAGIEPAEPALLALRLARGNAGLGLAIQEGGTAGRSTARIERLHDHLESLLAAHDAQLIADMQRAGRFRARTADLDPAVRDRLLGQGARLEETRRPQPDIEAQVRSTVRRSALVAQLLRHRALSVAPRRAA